MHIINCGIVGKFKDTSPQGNSAGNPQMVLCNCLENDAGQINRNDCLHVSITTVSELDLAVSENFMYIETI
jgi:hypothetical protein